MNFYKIQNLQNLSNTSYRRIEEIRDGYIIEYNEGYIDKQWEEITEKYIQEYFPDWLLEEDNDKIVEKYTQPTQLDQIQSMIDYLAMMIGE